MAFKKHQPRRFGRPAIRRDRCPYCDGIAVIDEMRPPFGFHYEGADLPFSVQLYTHGCSIVTEVTYPDQGYTVLKHDIMRPFDPELLDPNRLPEHKYVHVEPRRVGHAAPIAYCPKCGRDLRSKRPRVWR
ncbi:MAG: hypothetical protein IJ092_06350 [Atopobiaceae bacterium]|nr:hypothetical protein [Atopobiaceae bacterium]